MREVAVLDCSARVTERTAETPSSLDELHERTHVRFAALATDRTCWAQIDQWGLRLQKRIYYHGRNLGSSKEERTTKEYKLQFHFQKKKETKTLISVNNYRQS